MWDDVPLESSLLWTGQPGYSGLIIQSSVTQPYGLDCYNVEITRDLLHYPRSIILGD